MNAQRYTPGDGNGSSPKHNTDGATRDSQSEAARTVVTSIPLSEEGTGAGSEPSIGSLARDASTHLSTLVRGELEFAKAEIAGEVRKGIKGSVYFVIALTVLCFSLFFLFFTLAEGLAFIGLWRWAAFGITTLAMLLVAGALALLGYLRVRKIRAPQRTISSLKDTAQLRHRHEQEADQQSGSYRAV